MNATKPNRESQPTPGSRFRLAILPILLFIITSCTWPQLPKNTSLRVITYNTHLISPGMRCLPGIELEELLITGGIGLAVGDWTALAIELALESIELTECLAHADDLAPNEAEVIATNILAANYDVIALNEVFDEDAKDVFVNRLSTRYPHFVRRLDADPFFEDSGLMLFSRFPFDPLPDDTFRATDFDATSGEVAFALYGGACAGVDCLSAKGAGLVRIRVPNALVPLEVFTVVFTHMQADYDNPGESASERERQFDRIVEMLQTTLQHDQFDDDSIIIMGDLNIEGSNGVWSGGAPVGGGSEWQQFVKTNDPRALYDAWAATTSVDDIGLTHTLDKQRLDYIVTSRMLTFGRGCVQHMTNAYLGESDHIAVTADINRENNYCDPRRAWENPPLDTLLNVNPAISTSFDSTQIQSPGSMQWFHVTLDEPATVSIVAEPSYNANTGAGVAIEVYAPGNLSIPIPQYLSETTTVTIGRQRFTGKKYLLPQEFYIRVFSPNRLWTGDYSLAIHKHNCQNANDACVLQVNNPHVYHNLFKAGVLLGLEDTAWFQVDVTDRADSGAPQHLRLFADAYVDNLFSFELRDKTTPTTPVTLAGEVVLSLSSLHQIEADEVGPISVYLLARRENISVESRLRVGWESNLTRLHGLNLPINGGLPMKLICVDETNGFGGNEMGDDEIHLLVNVDGMGFQEILYHDYDCNNEAVSVTLTNPAHVFRFVNNVQVKLVEEDGSINPDDPGPTLTINTLPLNIFPPSQDLDPAKDVRVANTSGTWNFEGGTYRFEYSLSHQVQAQ